MKKIIFTLIAMMVMASSAIAQNEKQGKQGKQERKDPKEMVEKRTAEMTKKYALSTEQAAKVKALNEKYMGKRGPRPDAKDGKRPAPPKDGAAPKDGKKPGDKKGGKGMRPDMEQYNKELKAILNDTQYKAYIADMEKRKAEHKAKHEKK